MKANPIFLLLFVSLFATAAFGQSSSKVTLRLKNNGLLPRKFKFLEKRAGMKPDNVFTAYILPGQSYKVELKVGTSLAQVTQPEIYASMRGQDVTGKPLLVVKAEDEGSTVNLIQK
jgi:hypothetical protein